MTSEEFNIQRSLQEIRERMADIERQIMALRKFVWAHVEAHNAMPEWRPRIKEMPLPDAN